jgi:hypothetical protein
VGRPIYWHLRPLREDLEPLPNTRTSHPPAPCSRSDGRSRSASLTRRQASRQGHNQQPITILVAAIFTGCGRYPLDFKKKRSSFVGDSKRAFQRTTCWGSVCIYFVEPAVGIEPTTGGLQNRCSATELRWHRDRYSNANKRRSSAAAQWAGLTGTRIRSSTG